MHVLHLTGSAVNPFFARLSHLYAQDCLTAVADPERYRFTVADVSPDGCWRFADSLEPDILAASPVLSRGEGISRLAELRPDVTVPQMFCLPGMTTYRSLLDLLGLPYLGNPPSVMAIGADKALARSVVAASGVAVPDAEVLTAGRSATLRPPTVVKPVDADNSAGVTLVREPGEYPAALAAALHHSDRALAERYVELGREVRCGVVVRDGRAVPLPLEEYAVDTITKPIRDASDKIDQDDGGSLALTAKTSERAWIVPSDDPITGIVQEAALRCHQALGCRQYSLFDFRVDDAGRAWFLEAGLYCSFARQSVIPTMAAAAGIALPDLFGGMIDDLLGRSHRR